MQFSIAQPRFDQLNVMLRRGDAFFRLLLEGVEHVHGASKLYGINSPVRITIEIIDELQYRTTTKSSHGSSCCRLSAPLYLVQGKANTIPHLGREAPEILQA